MEEKYRKKAIGLYYVALALVALALFISGPLSIIPAMLAGGCAVGFFKNLGAWLKDKFENIEYEAQE